MQRAYSVLQVKDISEDARTITGMATTPATDRMGDIVEPDGVVYKLPLPLLWQHDSAQPIGTVDSAKVSKDGIAITARIYKSDAPGAVKDRLDEAWESIKLGLVRGLSIGFRSLESARIKDTWSEHFLKWEWLELSAVTIPANSEASIASIKSACKPAAKGTKGKQVAVVHLNSPGASGLPSKEPEMQTYAEQIQSWAAKRAATVASLDALMKKSAESGLTLNTEEQGEYDGFEAEVDEIDGHLARLKKAEARAKQTAAPVNTDPTVPAGEPARQVGGAGRTVLHTRAPVEKGIGMARYAMALIRAQGNAQEALELVKANKGWMEQTPGVAAMLNPNVVEAMKTAIPAGDTTTSGWASELVYAQNLQEEFINYLRPLTIIGRLQGFRNVPFNIRVGSQTAGGTGYWVGQGSPVPMSKPTVSSLTLGITKAAGMMAIDEELARSGTPSAELLVRNDLAKTIQAFVDLAFIDPNQGGTANVQPASVAYNVTPVTPSGTNYAALATDLKSLFSTAIAANLDISKFVWVMSPTTALALSLMQTSLGNPQFPTISINGGTFAGLPVVVSNAANIAGSPDYANMMMIVAPSEIFLADDGGVDIQVSREASIQMLDNPTNLSTGATTATTMVSMFQTHSLAIKAVRFINWKVARSQACAFIRTAAYA